MSGLCECGCGEPTTIAKKTHKQSGHVRGQPVRFIRGHQRIGATNSEETRRRISEGQWGKVRGDADEINRSALHKWLRRHFTKTGFCDRCQTEKRTDWAFLRHPLPYTRNREDYVELCRSCHMSMDYEIGYRTHYRSKGIA